MNEYEIPVADLETLRTGLGVLITNLEAQDIAEAARFLMPAPDWAPLTMEARSLLEMVENHISEFAVQQYEANRETTEDGEIVVDFTEDESDDSED